MIAGNFSVFPFLSVLQMLMASGHTGELNIAGRLDGSLWLEEGAIIHAEVGTLVGEAALQLLTTTDSGLFEFEPGRQPVGPSTTNLSGDLALRQLFQETEAWKPYMAEFGDWEQGFRFTAQWNPSFQVVREQFEVLRAVEHGLTLGEMVEQIKHPPRTILGNLRQFKNAGWIEADEFEF